MRRAQEARLVGFRRRHLAGDAAAEQHDRPIAGEADLGQFRGEQAERTAPCVGDLAQERIDLLLGADVDAARRVEAEQGA